MKIENWLKKRERKEKICQDLFEHTSKNNEEIFFKVSKTFTKEPFFEKASHNGNWETHIFRRENKEDSFPCFWKRVADSENTKKKKNKRKEKNKKKEERHDKKHTQKNQKGKSSEIEKEIRNLFFSKKIAEGQKKKTKRQENMDTRSKVQKKREEIFQT